MPLPELDNLVRAGVLQAEAPSRAEFVGLLRSAETRLVDAARADMSSDSRFDLAYNAAHALALAALRSHGYRAEKRYVVFPALEHTLGVDKPTWLLLAKCHDLRNRIEYGGLAPVDEALLAGLVEAPRGSARAVRWRRGRVAMSQLHRITVSPGVCGGRPCIRGPRVRVKDVLDLLAAGATREEILADYPYLEAEDITAALELAAKQSDPPVLLSA